MLEKLDLTLSLSKNDYQERLPGLLQRLFELQTACWRNAVASMLVFEGIDGAGVNSCLSLLTQPLEPRGFRLHAIQAPRTSERQMPWLWRFWLRLPNYGQIGHLRRKLVPARSGRTGPEGDPARRPGEGLYHDISGFERTLADDGYAICKFFFHIAAREQKKRLEKIAADPLEAWDLKPDWKERHRRYGRYKAAAEEMIARTDSEWAPWTLVEATDRRWARIKVFDAIARSLEAALQARGST
jgi:AMP-polyphosphate phosphotransferase